MGRCMEHCRIGLATTADQSTNKVPARHNASAVLRFEEAIQRAVVHRWDVHLTAHETWRNTIALRRTLLIGIAHGVAIAARLTTDARHIAHEAVAALGIDHVTLLAAVLRAWRVDGAVDDENAAVRVAGVADEGVMLLGGLRRAASGENKSEGDSETHGSSINWGKLPKLRQTLGASHGTPAIPPHAENICTA